MTQVDQDEVRLLCLLPKDHSFLSDWSIELDKKTRFEIRQIMGNLFSEIKAFRSNLFYSMYWEGRTWTESPRFNGVTFESPNDTLNPVLDQLVRARLDCLYNYSEGCGKIEPLHDLLSSAKVEFGNRFPKAVELRHALHHRAQIAVEFDKNALRSARNKDTWLKKSKDSELLVGMARVGFKISSTRKGEWLELDTGPSCYSKLVAHYQWLGQQILKQEQQA